MSALRQLYGQPLALLTDLYQLTMAYAHWRSGDPEREAVFCLFFRAPPFGAGPAIICGLDMVREYLLDLSFSDDDLAYLGEQRDPRGQRLFDPEFLNYLRDLRFTGDLDAVPEGTAVFAQTPLLRVRAPILQAQLLESALLNLVNFPTLIATKAARLVAAAGGDPVLDFGLRKAHGPSAGVLAARAAYVGGCAGTANVLAGKLFGIPIRGTHAHGWIMAFDDEREAFARYAEALPNNCIFLVDTYDSLRGVANAIETGHWLRRHGHEMTGIRLDSGNLAELAWQARRMLDTAGFPEAVITASSSLDEHAIAQLKRDNIPIGVWGVGTALSTGQPDGALDGVYKLTALRDREGAWQPKQKLSDSPGKETSPGVQQVRRYYDGDTPLADWIYDEGDIGADFAQARAVTDGRALSKPPADRHQDLLEPVLRAGRDVAVARPLAAVREHALAEYARFAACADYSVALEQRLAKERDKERARLTSNN